MFSLFVCSYLSEFPGQILFSLTLGEGFRLITHVCENNWLLINMASEFRPIILLVKMDYNFDDDCLQ